MADRVMKKSQGNSLASWRDVRRERKRHSRLCRPFVLELAAPSLVSAPMSASCKSILERSSAWSNQEATLQPVEQYNGIWQISHVISTFPNESTKHRKFFFSFPKMATILASNDLCQMKVNPSNCMRTYGG